MKIDLDELKAAALAATPGPWLIADENTPWNIHDAIGFDVAISQQRTTVHQNPKQTDRTANAKFIAAANPAVVLALLAELEFEKQNNAGVAGMVEDYETKLEAKDKRIAELEGSATLLTNQRDLWYGKVQDLEAKLARFGDVRQHYLAGYDDGHSRGLNAGRLYKEDTGMVMHRHASANAYAAEGDE